MPKHKPNDEVLFNTGNYEATRLDAGGLVFVDHLNGPDSRTLDEDESECFLSMLDDLEAVDERKRDPFLDLMCKDVL